MHRTTIEAELAALDAVLEPLAKTPVDVGDPDWAAKMRAAPPAVRRAGVEQRAVAALHRVIDAYANGDEVERSEVRALFVRYPSFRWAVGLAEPATTAEGFRLHLLHLSARDQRPDGRDELLTLGYLCEQAVGAGIDIRPALVEVAGLSSDVDHYRLGSTRQMILTCLARWA